MKNRTLVAALILAGRKANPEAGLEGDVDIACSSAKRLLERCGEDPDAVVHLLTYTYTKDETAL